jgi:HKD family nuclease
MSQGPPIRKLHPGLYEQLINKVTDAGIAEAERDSLRSVIQSLDAGDSHTYFTQYLSEYIRRSFSSLPKAERLNRQINLANRIITLLAESAPGSFDPNQARLLRAELLLGILQEPAERPDTPLSTSCLMTGTRQDPSLVSQLWKEILTADRVDILCSFIKWGGVRILEEPLSMLTNAGKRLRVITTSYMGTTDLKAVDFLQCLPNTELRISYDTRRTRLHAKAYIIHRQTGFGTAYIGSSNLSQAALTDGLEWNVKISQHESPHLWAKVSATFDTYWNDKEFVPYGSESRERLSQALEKERRNESGVEVRTLFDIIEPAIIGLAC